jgi:hypothetical protein
MTVISFEHARARKMAGTATAQLHKCEVIKKDLKIAVADTLKYHGINALEVQGLTILFSMISEVVDNHTGDGSEVMDVVNAVVAIKEEIEHLNGDRMI